MFHRKLGVAAVAAALALGLNAGAALAASSGSNSGSAPDQGNCLGNFVNGGSNGFNVSNDSSPPKGAGPGLGQFVGQEEHGCR